MNSAVASNLPIGRILVDGGLISHEQLQEALALQQRWGSRLGDILIARGWITAARFQEAIGRQLGHPVVNLADHPVDDTLIDAASLRDCVARLYLPWQRTDSRLRIAVSEPEPGLLAHLEQRYGPECEVVLTSRQALVRELQRLIHRLAADQADSAPLLEALSQALISPKVRLGDMLIADGLITEAQLQEALSLQKTWQARLGDVIVANGWVSPQALSATLADQLGLPLARMGDAPLDSDPIQPELVDAYLENLFLPWQRQDGVLQVAVVDPSAETVSAILAHIQEPLNLAICTKFDLLQRLQHAFQLNEADADSQGRVTRLIAAKQVSSKVRIGDILVAKGLLSEAQLQEALVLQKRWGSRLGDIILAKGWLKPFEFYRTLASHFGLRFLNLIDNPPDFALVNQQELTSYTELLVLPWRRENGVLVIATTDPTPEALEFVAQRFKEPVEFVITSKFDIIWQVQQNANAFLSDMAVNELLKRNPEMSARYVFTTPQLAFFYVLGMVGLLCLVLWPLPTLLAINAFITVLLVLNFGLRYLFTWVGSDKKIDVKVTDEEVRALVDAELPTYTVLVPMYKEPEVLPIITEALRKLDYPLSKLDVKLVLEQDDEETIQRAKELGLEGIFEIIRVPPSLPKTKPKACNYALAFARGELLTIYDGEDHPEPDQLKKAVVAFRKASPNTAVIQARLNYFNADENWLTRMFTLEYSVWFDFYLPALEALGIPIPLGGTSNHFKMHVLREVNAWDPYNVTEDADLGVRLTQLNYHVGVVNSTTYEEANNHVGNWIRQRSRWIKGYMQTYLVHMRHPVHLYRTLGHVGFWGFQFFVGGAVLSVLVTPVLYLMYLFWLFTQTHALDVLYPPVLLYLSLFNLIIGNGFFIYLFMLSVFKRHLYSLSPWALTVPAYWLLMSIAGYKALWQLIHKPFYWEKTQHGLTRFKAGTAPAEQPGGPA